MEHHLCALTILQRRGNHLRGRGSGPCTVAGLHYNSILGEFLEVVQDKMFSSVPSGFHTDHTELVVSTRAVLPIAHLITSDGAILEVLLRCLK